MMPERPCPTLTAWRSTAVPSAFPSPSPRAAVTTASVAAVPEGMAAEATATTTAVAVVADTAEVVDTATTDAAAIATMVRSL